MKAATAFWICVALFAHWMWAKGMEARVTKLEQAAKAQALIQQAEVQLRQ